MSRNNRFRRSPLVDQPIRDNGPYEAIVVNHFDRLSMGSLEVELLKYSRSNSSPERSGQLITVRYLSPFYGVTPYKGLTENDGYENTQKSYGMWMVPPDPGTRVLVIFAEGNPAYGYWIGCIQDQGMNFMLPDGRASTINTTDDTPKHLANKKLPVGEYNKKIELGDALDPTLFRKPYNKDFTNVLQVQGLLNDEARGTTTSSARRETPSMVFGISTPGPLDKRQGAPKYKYGPTDRSVDYFFNRLGGSSFVMDDGDDKFIRATHAEDGPPIYINREKGETGGDETIPQNELMRFRTRTGHQILLHNSEDLIYISNSRGTAWIELTSDGKIDIHAQDSISIMSDTDINFTAERDFNVDVGRNINMRASARWSDFKTEENGYESGRVQIESKYNMNLMGEKSVTLSTKDLNINNATDFKLFVDGNFHLLATGNIYQESTGSTHLTSKKSFFQYVKNNYHVDIDENSYFTTFKDQHRKAGYSHTLSKDTITNKPLGGNIYDESSGEIHVRSFPRCGDPWKPNYYYLKDYTVTYDNKCWKAIVEHRSGSSFDQSKWVVTGTGTGTIYISAAADIHTNAGNSIYDTAGASIHRVAGSGIYDTASSGINLVGGDIIAGDATQVHWNSKNAEAASSASEATPARMSDTATPSDLSDYRNEEIPPRESNNVKAVPPLRKFSLPYVIPGVEQPVSYESILLRAPQHEPWPHHENMNPLAFKRQETDIQNQESLVTTADRILTPDTFLKNKTGLASSIRVSGSGGNITAKTNSGNDEGYEGTGNKTPLSTDRTAANQGTETETEQKWTASEPSEWEKEGTSSGNLIYENQGGIRNKTLEPKLENLLKKTAQEIGVDVYVYSGGQDPANKPNARRMGSNRHDYGSAADIYLKNQGRKVQGGTPLFLAFVEAFFRNGGRGGGSGGYTDEGKLYMGGPRSPNMHLDIVGRDRGFGIYWNSAQYFIDAVNKGRAQRTKPIVSDFVQNYGSGRMVPD